MDQLVGKWRIIHEATENFDAFADAMKFPADIKQKVKDEKKVEVVMTKEGGGYKIVVTTGDHVDTHVMKLGEKFVTNDFGIKAENVCVEEGDVVVGTHTAFGQTTKSRRYVKDNKLFVESEINGVTTKNVFERF